MRQVRDFALGDHIKESSDHLGDVGVVHGGPDAGITIGGFFDTDVDVRHIPLQDSLKNIVRQRWEINCKHREQGSEGAREREVSEAEFVVSCAGRRPASVDPAAEQLELR